MIVGITGSSGSGKTTVCKILKNKYNAFIIDCDKIAKEMLTKGTEYYNSVVESFGNEILQENGEINRKKLADIIYQNNNMLVILNELTNKYVVSKIMKQAEERNEDLIIIDAPLLIESKLKDICNIIISVLAKEEIKINRICKRDGIENSVAIKRLNIQPKDEFYVKNSDYIIYNNNDDENNLENKIQEILEALNV